MSWFVFLETSPKASNQPSIAISRDSVKSSLSESGLDSRKDFKATPRHAALMEVILSSVSSLSQLCFTGRKCMVCGKTCHRQSLQLGIHYVASLFLPSCWHA